jgi:hypothetical protein
MRSLWLCITVSLYGLYCSFTAMLMYCWWCLFTAQIRPKI